MLISFVDLAFADTVFCPASAIGSIVQKKRLAVIKHVCKFGVCTLICLKFVPEVPEPSALIFRKHSKNAVCRLCFPFHFSLRACFIICVGVARIDLNQIVDQHHRYNFLKVYFLVGIFAEKNCHQCQMPGMFCIVFLTTCI